MFVSTTGSWILSSHLSSSASNLEKPPIRARLFCFTHAGGGASAYQLWLRTFPADIDVCIIQLPGREQRIREKPFTQFEHLLSALIEVLQPYLYRPEIPYAFFGHSMGALISYGLTRAFVQQGKPLPTHLFVSAYRAPHLPLRGPVLHTLSETELVQFLLQLNGTQRELLENEELRSLFLPLLRADFSICETYQHLIDRERLPCPITVFGGLQDQRVTSNDLEAWSKLTQADFELRMFPGEHFFIHAQRNTIASIIMKKAFKREKI